jgi:ornithine cyclodeaminase
VSGADLVALATASATGRAQRVDRRRDPHLRGGRVPADQREWTALVARAYVRGSRTGALAEAGDVVLPIREGAFDASHIAGELGEVAAGALVGRQSPSEVTLFKSLGMAVEDVAAAHLAYARATERGLGRGFIL